MTIAVVIITPGILRKRNSDVAVENAARFFQASLPCRSSLYARTDARMVSPRTTKPSASFVGTVEIMSIGVVIIPMLIVAASSKIVVELCVAMGYTVYIGKRYAKESYYLRLQPF